jgi:hypothetical protein
MIRLTLHQNDYLATTKHYLSVYHTSTIQEDTDRAKGVLQNVLMFVVLAQYNNEQSDLLARVVREDAVKNDEMGWVGNFVKRFTDGELMRYTPPNDTESERLIIGGLWCRRFLARNSGKQISLLSIEVMERVNYDGKLSPNASLNT